MAKYRLRNSGVEAIHLSDPVYVKNPNAGFGQPRFLEYGRGWVLVVLEGKNVFMTAQEFHQKYEGEQEESVQTMPAMPQVPQQAQPWPSERPWYPPQPSENWRVWSAADTAKLPATPERESDLPKIEQA